MGNFLALTSVIGKTKNEVSLSLENYAKSVSGGLQQIDNLEPDLNNCCIIKEDNENVTIYYPQGYVEWDKSSQFISKELNTCVFSFHIHDGDFWMYVLFNKGEIIDQFNPIPDYWDDEISDEEIASWKGNVDTIIENIKGVKKADIEKYLVRWDLENKEFDKAYQSDEFEQEEWQLTDFMKKLNLPFPLDEDGNVNGTTFKLWTKELKLKNVINNKKDVNIINEKPWWKFW